MTSKQDSEAWLCLRFANLSLNSKGLSLNSKVVAATTYKQQIWQCNHLTKESGVQSGMSLNHALMLLPTLELHERDINLEVQKLEELSYWAYRFTSLVSIYNDHVLLLEIGRSIKLFSGLKHLLNLIYNDLISFDIYPKFGIAETSKAAYVLSFQRNQSFEKDNGFEESSAELFSDNEVSTANTRLNQIPLAFLDVNSKTIAQLHNCGFEVIADIHSIPHAELGHRFGAKLLKYLNQLWGLIADPQIGTTPPETFEVSADFAQPIANLNWINQQLDRLLNDLVVFTAQRQLICRSFTWRFYQENNRLLQTVTVGLSAKKNDFATYRELTDLKLSTIKLDWEFSSIELSSQQLVPIQLFHNDLFDPQPDQQQFNQLIDKLTNRLGQTALFRVKVAPEHLPELANDRQHAAQETHAPYAGRTSSDLGLANPAGSSPPFKDQPLWLLDPPQRLAQRHQQPHHEGPLNIIHGPHRITSHWWNKLQSRDYFIVRQHHGRLLWVFFDRGEHCWFLHGLFA
ncbi:MAG: protein ImuB [Arenicella sp.]|jgi:protein ImuB